jgi:hypothetical protein
VNEEDFEIIEAGYAPDDPAVIAAMIRVRAELAALGKLSGRFVHTSTQSAGGFAADLLRHHYLLEARC